MRLNSEPCVRPKVLYVHASLDGGGAQSMRYTLLKHMHGNSFAPTICCLGAKGRYGDRLEKLGYKVISLNRPSRIFDLVTTLRLYRIMKSDNFDIVHSSLFVANYHAALAAFFAGKPVCITEEHGEHSFHVKKRYIPHRLIGKLSSRLSKAVLCCSDSVSKGVAKTYRVPCGKIFVLRNMVTDKMNELSSSKKEVRSMLGVPLDALLIGSVGLLSWAKNHKLLIDCFSRINDKNSYLVIVGDGPERLRLEAHIAKLGLSSKVKLTGWREDIADILSALDIFVLSSRTEGLPMALLEAMSLGKPCIVTRVGGLCEVLDNGVTGRLVHPDDAKELIDAMNGLLENPRAAEEMGKNARKKILDEFMPGNYIWRLELIYNALMK